MENYNKLKSLVAAIEADADKFFNNGIQLLVLVYVKAYKTSKL